MQPGASSGPVLVTGASGIAGHHLLQAFREAGVEAIGVSRSVGPEGIPTDLRDAAAVARLALENGVVHAAGLTPRRTQLTWEDFYDANVRTTEVLAEAAVRRGARFFVHVSTAGIHARHAQTATGRLYVASKLIAERRLRQIARGRMPLWVVRPASLYGEYDSGNVARLIVAASRGWVLLPSAPRGRKCLLYAGSFGRVVAREVATGIAGSRTEAISDLEQYTLADVLGAIERAVGRRVRVVAPPAIAMMPALAAAAAIARALRAARLGNIVESARIALRDVPCPPHNALLRHDSARVSLADGLAREVEWMRRVGTI